jgi:hypothetical protein
LADGEDLGDQASRSLLQRHSTRFASPPLKIDARGAFFTGWRGDIQDSTQDKLRAALAGKTTANEQGTGELEPSQLDSVLASPQHREILIGILQLATPILSSPIYIGVAKSLRTRLRQHVDVLFKLANAAPATAEERDRLLSDSRFASRAVGMGFSADTLSVWTLNLSAAYPGKSNTDALRAVAETAEWLLNRWHRPLLGRR